MQAATTNSTPISASCTSGHFFSVQVSSSAPISAAPTAADLHAPAFRLEAERVGGGHAEARDLRDGEVDEDDAAIEHLLAQRHMRRQHQQARRETPASRMESSRLPMLISSILRAGG